MWRIREKENELTISAFPFLIWSFILACFVFEFFILQMYYEILSDAAAASGLLNPLDIILTLGVILIFPAIGLVLLHVVPFAETRIDRGKQVLTQTTYSLLGKRTREFGFPALKGGIRVSSEEDEDGKEQRRLYFETESDERIYLSKEFSFWKGRTFDVAIEANEFLRKKIDA